MDKDNSILQEIYRLLQKRKRHFQKQIHISSKHYTDINAVVVLMFMIFPVFFMVLFVINVIPEHLNVVEMILVCIAVVAIWVLFWRGKVWLYSLIKNEWFVSLNELTTEINNLIEQLTIDDLIVESAQNILNDCIFLQKESIEAYKFYTFGYENRKFSFNLKTLEEFNLLFKFQLIKPHYK
jgi:hypothetical protein